MRVLITTLVRDNERWVPQFYSMVDNLCRNFKHIHFDVFVYENDSVDSTKSLLKGDYFSTNFGHPKDMASRTKRLAFYRNDMKERIPDLGKYEYVLMIDSNITFGYMALAYMLETMISRDDVDMVIPNAMVRTSVPCEFYYDTFAMKLGQFDSVMECGHEGAKHDRHCHRITGSAPKFRKDGPDVEKVDYGFGGFVLVKRESFEKAKWAVEKETDCEHWAFCDQVGNIVLDKRSKVLWSEI